jgi:hypothetical protein
MGEFEHLNFIVNYRKADYSSLLFPEADKKILTDLARNVAEIAARPLMAERKKLWTDHNALVPTRPVLLCDPENGWNEIIPSSAIRCTNSIARHWENWLRKQVFWGEKMNDDYVVEPYFDVPHHYEETSWAVAGKEIHKEFRTDGGAYHIDAVLDDFDEELEKVVTPQLNIDWEMSGRLLALAHELFDGILIVRQKTWWFWSVGQTDDYVFLRGLDTMFMDFYDYPEKVHALAEKIYAYTDRRLDYLEASCALSLNNDSSFVGSGGMGFTTELPQTGFSGHVRTRDMWGLAESQSTVGVSPEMFAEFIFPYQKRMMERFGLSCYGCCEPLDTRIDIIKQISNLRRVSVSPWADRCVMAEKLGKEYVYSVKPSPTPLSQAVMDEDAVRKELESILDTAGSSILEIVMKDNHTLGGNPENVRTWVQIAREMIER